jgi:hypothetical protein
MTSDATPPVVVLGDVDHPDFRSVRQWLAKHCWVARFNDARSSTTLGVRAIVAFQARPSMIDVAMLEQAAQLHPLAQFVLVLGSWCEGETRSGRPIAGVHRTYWYHAQAYLQRLLYQNSTPPLRTLVIAEQVDLGIERIPRVAGRFEIHASTPLRREVLAEACSAIGLQPLSNQATVEPRLVLVDVGTLTESQLEFVADLRRMHPQSLHAAALDMPRSDEVAQLRAAGCDAVFGHPFLLADLAAVVATTSP